MTGAVLLIGDELLGGTIFDRNLSTIARAVGPRGVSLVTMEAVGDDETAIVAAAQRLAGASDCLFVTGGLGPTEDDRTRAAFARALGVEVVIDPRIEADLVERFRARGFPDPEAARRQATFPRGTTPVANPVGSAPGFCGQWGRARFWVLPGVPAEVRAMVDAVVADLPAPPAGHEWQRIVATAGLGETVVARRLREAAFEPPPSIRLGFLPSPGGVRLRLVGPGSAPRADFDAAEAAIRAILGARALPSESLAQALLDALRVQGATLATAESCTGGMIGAALTDVPGASDGYAGGKIAYANRAKVSQLGVPEAVLAEHGAVSEMVARAMAEGCREQFDTSLGLSVTGIAGPGGGSDEKPVGTVWIGLASEGGTEARRYVFPGSREMIRERTVNKALEMAYRGLWERNA